MKLLLATFLSLISVILGDHLETSTPSVDENDSSSCSMTKCPWHLWLHYINSKCQPEYHLDNCCPCHFNCKVQIDHQIGDLNTNCNYNGKTYSNGEQIVIHDKCISCTCNDNFNQKSFESYCTPLNCNTEEMNNKLDNGCIPIYEDNKCCPIDYQCPPSLNTKFRQGGEASRPTTNPNTQCIYGGQNYPRGFDLISGYKRGINCTCLTPPMFTCTVPSCPEPPFLSNEMLRCKNELFLPIEKVCPEYNCWNILEETEHIGSPQTAKEKSLCDTDPCPLQHQCIVNYTKCHLEECEKQCEVCPIPGCLMSKYEAPINKCPTCVRYSTPEEICESFLNTCSNLECTISDESRCRMGSCTPACRLNQVVPEKLDEIIEEK